MENGFLRQQFEISKNLINVMQRDFDIHYKSVQLMTDTCSSLIKKLEERDAEISRLRKEIIELRSGDA